MLFLCRTVLFLKNIQLFYFESMTKGILFTEAVGVLKELTKRDPSLVRIQLNKNIWLALRVENGFRNLTELLKAFKKEGLIIHKITVR